MKKLSRLTLACILVVAMLTGMIAFSAEFFLSPDTNWTSRVDGVSKFNSFALAIADNQFANSGGIVVMGYIGTVGTTPPTYMGADAQLMNSNGIMYGHSGDTYCDNGNITSGDFISFYATPPTAPPPGTYYGRADTWTYFGGEQDRQMTFNTASTKCVPGIVFSREDSSESAALFSASETVPSWDDTIRVNESGQTYGTLPIDPNGEIPELVAA
ncbi:MAG: hypothetical protein LBR85_00745, partial [Oscillospiraceae bacterium]|nr:hypothetical protein [Oscillospiraceae bacterium]